MVKNNGVIDNLGEWVRWIIAVAINVIIMVVAIMTAYGSLDKRVTILEVKQEKKIDGVLLEQKLNEWKKEIVHEIKEAIKNEK